MLLACCHATVSRAVAPASTDCDESGRAAELQFGLPTGLLHAIGTVESGRWDATRGQVTPWPWAIDFAGQGKMFDNEADALHAVRAALGGGQRNIDVGCFQINLLYHPLAFTDLSQAFDAHANADYAARLLTSLHAEYGTWRAAVAAYHSATPQLGEPYQQRVYAAWSGAPANADRDFAGYSLIAGVRVWTPLPPGDAPLAIHLVPDGRNLPRIVTPAR